jgi:2-methylisocitrate lyase-like PEP mutase family enzyme
MGSTRVRQCGHVDASALISIAQAVQRFIASMA